MYIGSKEDEHTSLGDDMKDALEEMLYVCFNAIKDTLPECASIV